LPTSGPVWNTTFLVFNLNDCSGKKLDGISRKQAWFQDLKFRQAVSAAVDRDSIVKLSMERAAQRYGGTSDRETRCGSISRFRIPSARSKARVQLLKSAGFTWDASGQLLDHTGQPVEFSIATSSSNAQRMKMATLLQDDLSHLGMQVHVVPLDFRAMIDRVSKASTMRRRSWDWAGVMPILILR